MNLLFIMADQLRFDYLGCYGHPTIRTPNIDARAARADGLPKPGRTTAMVSTTPKGPRG